MAGEKKAYIASSRGGGYGDNSLADLEEDFLKTLFNFTGVNDVEIIRAEGVSISEFEDEAVANAMQKIQAI